MDLLGGGLIQDVVLDEEAFEKAIADFENLGEKLNNLRKEIEEMVDALKEGFNTPAGVKFINSCEANLFKPLDDQQLVLNHISSTLKDAKQSYSSVFDEYDRLKGLINSVNN